MSSLKISKFCSNSELVFGVFFKFEISCLRAGFSFRQALSRLAFFTLLCCLAAALSRVQARHVAVLFYSVAIFIKEIVLYFTCLIMKSFDYFSFKINSFPVAFKKLLLSN